MQPTLAKLMETSGGAMLEMMEALRELNIPVLTSHKLQEITDTGVVCQDLTKNETVTFAADTVLLAVGMRPNFEVADRLRRSAPETEVYVVGDAIKAQTIAEATKSAFKAAAYI